VVSGRSSSRDDSYGPDTLSATQVERLAASGPGNARQLISVAREVAEHPDTRSPQQLFDGIERRRARAEMVGGRPAAMLVTELDGGSSGSPKPALFAERKRTRIGDCTPMISSAAGRQLSWSPWRSGA
jgi:hypothetical protein